MSNTTTTLSVATTILEQLGGGRFLAMTGAKDLVGDAGCLMFRIPRNASGASKCRIELGTDDLYTMTFYSFRKLELKTIACRERLFAEDLAAAFTAVTGFDTRL